MTLFLSPRDQWNGFVLLLIVVFVDISAGSMLWFALPSRMLELDVPTTVQGAAQSLHGVLQLASAFVIGALADMRSRREALIVAMVAATVTSLGYGLAQSSAEVVLAGIPLGIGHQCVNLAQASVSHSVAPGDRTRFLSFIAAAVGVGMIVGPFVGGSLLPNPSLVSAATKTLSDTSSARVVGAPGTLPFFVAALLFATNVLLVRLIPTSFFRSYSNAQRDREDDRIERGAEVGLEEERRAQSTVAWITSYVSLFRAGRLGQVLLVRLFLGVAFALCNATLILGVYKRFPAATPQQVGLMQSALALLDIGNQSVVLPWLSAHVTDTRLLRGALLSVAFSLVLVGSPMASLSLGVLACFLLLYAVGGGLCRTASTAMIVRLAPPERVTSVLAFKHAFKSVTRATIPLLSASLFESFGPGAPSLVAGVVAFVATSLLAHATADLMPLLAGRDHTINI